MSEIRMTAEIRTDYDCETTGLPAEDGQRLYFRSVMKKSFKLKRGSEAIPEF